jgi:hypothetical protein
MVKKAPIPNDVGTLLDNIKTIGRVGNVDRTITDIQFFNNDDVLDAVLSLGVKKQELTRAGGSLVVSGNGLESLKPVIKAWEKS